MILNTKIEVFMAFLGCETHFKSELHRISVEIDMEKLHTIFIIIERRFRCSKSRFSRFKETCA